MKNIFVKSEFSKNVLTLMSGTLVAQAIPIAISPILTRIYSPEDFGLFATYMGILMIFGSLVAGRYELAILIPKNDNDAKHVVFYSIFLSLISSTILFVVILIFNDMITDLLKNDKLGVWLYLLPLNIFIVSATSILYNWNNRKKGYKNLSSSLMIQSSAQGATNISIGVSTKFGAALIVGTFIGNLSSFLYLIKKTKYNFLGFSPNISRVIVLMKRYIKFPKYSMPSVLLENVSAQLPIFFLGSFFGTSVVGFYSLSQRIIRLPIMLIGSSMGSVFRQEASLRLYRDGDCRDIFKKTFKKLFIISTIPFLIFYTVAPQLFAFVFGEAWVVAGEYAQILAPLFYLQFLVSPLSGMFSIAQKQQYDLLMQIYLVTSVVLAFVVGYRYFNNIEISLMIFTVVYSLKYIFELIMAYKFTIREV